MSPLACVLPQEFDLKQPESTWWQDLCGSEELEDLVSIYTWTYVMWKTVQDHCILFFTVFCVQQERKYMLKLEQCSNYTYIMPRGSWMLLRNSLLAHCCSLSRTGYKSQFLSGILNSLLSFIHLILCGAGYPFQPICTILLTALTIWAANRRDIFLVGMY